jgi:hypothetical protein
MSFFDKHPGILAWSSEELIVPYRSPVDGKQHRYWPDFMFRHKKADGTIVTVVVEVKPASQSQAPTRKIASRKPTRRFIKETMTWGVNEAKWVAAKTFCEARGWKFVVWNEKTIQGLG